jgi:hypothetical protein
MSLALALAELRDDLAVRMQDRWGGELALLVARTADVLARYKAHIQNSGGTWHASPDTANDLIATAPVTRPQCYELLNRLRANLPAHFAATGAVHLVADTANAISSPEAKTSATGIALANELADVLDAHRDEPGVHSLDDTGNAITSDPAAPGAIAAPVQVGDRHLSKNYSGHPRVVFAWNGATPNGPKNMSTNPRAISQRDCLVEAHCWIAEAESEDDFGERDIQRIADAEGLLDELERSVYALQHGVNAVRTQPFTEISTVRDVELMRFGEECIALFVVPIPVTEGPTYLTALGTATAGIPGGLVVNPAP